MSFLRSRPVKRHQSTSLLPPPVSRLDSLSNSHRALAFAMAGFLGGSAFIYSIINPNKFSTSRAKKMMGLETGNKELEQRKLTSREKRFVKFASVEFQGQVYMTPQDFLESVIEAEPKPRLKRRNLTSRDISSIAETTPDMRQNTDHMFRSLGNKGIIAYTEYLFLLTILIKPFSGFKIAFSMLDQDGNERIDKEEFKVLESIFASAAKEREEKESEEHGLVKHEKVDTSLLLHLFGRDGEGRELIIIFNCLLASRLTFSSYFDYRSLYRRAEVQSILYLHEQPPSRGPSHGVRRVFQRVGNYI